MPTKFQELSATDQERAKNALVDIEHGQGATPDEVRLITIYVRHLEHFVDVYAGEP